MRSFGNRLPKPWTHRGYAPEDLVAHLYMTLEGIFGSTVDVSSSLIILFTIFGAVLQHSGAGRFFIDFSFAAMGGRRNAPGAPWCCPRSCSAVRPARASRPPSRSARSPIRCSRARGYGRNEAGGLLAAGGLGAIISPPVLGAAAFLIAEFLKISYFDVILMAVIPTVLYYLSILVMVELDAAKHGGGGELDGAAGHAVAADARLLVPLRLARLHRRLHAGRLFAGAGGVLGDDAGDRAELPERDTALVPPSSSPR